MVDKETGALCAEGEPGELWLGGTRGIELFLEYFDNDEANAKAFPEDGWFKTGDMVEPRHWWYLFYRSAQGPCSRWAARTSRPERSRTSSPPWPASTQVAVVGKHSRLLDHAPWWRRGAPAPAPTRRRSRRPSSRRAGDRLADFKVPRAVYAVEGFPLGTLDKVLKNKLREMADERPPV